MILGTGGSVRGGSLFLNTALLDPGQNSPTGNAYIVILS